ncbi:PadR family transcriptional regulator [Fusicatenibacter sp.]
MGTLKYAILGLLNRNAMTGYELSKEFETTLFEFWNAKHSQIYPELKSLNAAGLIEYHVEITGNVLEKKVYTITDEGRRDFLSWEETLCPIQTATKDESRLRLFFLDSASSDFRLQFLEDQRQQHQAHLTHLLENQQKFDTVPPKEARAFSDYLVLRGAVLREEAALSWIEECLQLANQRKSNSASQKNRA